MIFITHGSKCYYRWDLYYAWVQNVITDGTFITLGSKCYYRWYLYYTWVQLLHLCLRSFHRYTNKSKLWREKQTNLAWSSLRKHPFLRALRRWGRFARRNVCDSATEIPYWWCKLCRAACSKIICYRDVSFGVTSPMKCSFDIIHLPLLFFTLISFYYRDVTFSTVISFDYRDGKFSTLISFYYRDGPFCNILTSFDYCDGIFTSLLSFYYRDVTFSTLISFDYCDGTFSSLISFYYRDVSISTLISFLLVPCCDISFYLVAVM